jgi:hypothetical protein
MVLPAARHANDDECIRPDGNRGNAQHHLLLISHVNDSYRRVYTDGRDWSEDIEPTYAGYSIGKWIDEDNDGRYDTLEIETRSLKLPRTYDATGLPFHKDGEAIVKERIYLDKADGNLLHDDITTIDHALTQPWTVNKTYRRDPKVKRPAWITEACAGDNAMVRIGEDAYFLSTDGPSAARPSLFQAEQVVRPYSPTAMLVISKVVETNG